MLSFRPAPFRSGAFVREHVASVGMPPHATARKETQEHGLQEAQATAREAEAGKRRRQRQAELEGLKLKELRRRAREVGVHPEKLEDAMDTDDPYGTVIEILMQLPPATDAQEQVMAAEALPIDSFVDRLRTDPALTTAKRTALESLEPMKKLAETEATIRSYVGSADDAVKLQQLLDMGYPRKDAQAALATCHGDLNAAANSLLQTAMHYAIRRLQGATEDIPPTQPTVPAASQPEAEPEPVYQDDDPYRKELRALRVSSLKRRLIALGATEKQIDLVDDAEERGETRKDAAVELIVQLTAGLRKLTYNDLKRKIRRSGLPEADIEGLDDNDDVMAAAIDKLLELIARDD
eukprot:COSAG02_NODE_4637_length_5143_cov_3.538660_4_plen_351_part_00